MKVLLLVNNNPVTVDDDDYSRCNSLFWKFHPDGYVRMSGRPGTYLHLFIKGRSPKGLIIDHEDQNKLNNQKSNLRFVTQQTNRLNGAYLKNPRHNIYQTSIGHYRVSFERVGKLISLGVYETLDEAICVRNNYLLKDPAFVRSVSPQTLALLHQQLTSRLPLPVCKTEHLVQSAGHPTQTPSASEGLAVQAQTDGVEHLARMCGKCGYALPHCACSPSPTCPSPSSQPAPGP